MSLRIDADNDWRDFRNIEGIKTGKATRTLACADSQDPLSSADRVFPATEDT